LQRISAYLCIVGSKRSISKNRFVKEIDRGHRHYDPVCFARLTKLAHDLVALCRRSVNRDQIVVVIIDAPGADFSQHSHGIHRLQGWANGVAKRVAAAIAHGP